MTALATETWTCPKCGAQEVQPSKVSEVLHPCPKSKTLVSMKLNHTFVDPSKKDSKEDSK